MDISGTDHNFLEEAGVLIPESNNNPLELSQKHSQQLYRFENEQLEEIEVININSDLLMGSDSLFIADENGLLLSSVNNLDIDGNNKVEQQDYNLIDLFASQLDDLEFGFLIDNFTNDLIAENASRNNADLILTYFDTIVPETV